MKISNLIHFGKNKAPYNETKLRNSIPYDPENHIPVIRSSICTGEKVAGFREKTTGHFTEVMMIRNEQEKQQFMKIYGLTEVKTEY